jgi:hypothetical protein
MASFGTCYLEKDRLEPSKRFVTEIKEKSRFWEKENSFYISENENCQ